MQFISEENIIRAGEALGESEGKYEQSIDQLREEQPLLLSFLFSESFQAFTQSEKEYLLYLMLVVWKAVKLSGEEVPAVSEKELSEAEERNWNLLQGVKARRFHERLDVFFVEYPQEDLLAFVEDALADVDAEEGEPMVSGEGREAMFVSLKSVIDCLAGPFAS